MEMTRGGSEGDFNVEGNVGTLTSSERKKAAGGSVSNEGDET